MPLSRVVRCGITERSSRECTVKVILGDLEAGGRCPKQSLCIQRRLNRRRVVSGKETRLYLSDPIPTFRQRKTSVTCQMTLELKLVEVLVIERAEFRCQATKCPDDSEQRGD